MAPGLYSTQVSQQCLVPSSSFFPLLSTFVVKLSLLHFVAHPSVTNTSLCRPFQFIFYFHLTGIFLVLLLISL